MANEEGIYCSITNFTMEDPYPGAVTCRLNKYYDELPDVKDGEKYGF